MSTFEIGKSIYISLISSYPMLSSMLLFSPAVPYCLAFPTTRVCLPSSLNHPQLFYLCLRQVQSRQTNTAIAVDYICPSARRPNRITMDQLNEIRVKPNDGECARWTAMAEATETLSRDTASWMYGDLWHCVRITSERLRKELHHSFMSAEYFWHRVHQVAWARASK